MFIPKANAASWVRWLWVQAAQHLLSPFPSLFLWGEIVWWLWVQAAQHLLSPFPSLWGEIAWWLWVQASRRLHIFPEHGWLSVSVHITIRTDGFRTKIGKSEQSVGDFFTIYLCNTWPQHREVERGCILYNSSYLLMGGLFSKIHHWIGIYPEETADPFENSQLILNTWNCCLLASKAYLHTPAILNMFFGQKKGDLPTNLPPSRRPLNLCTTQEAWLIDFVNWYLGTGIRNDRYKVF
jgi:hypothetical protein